MQCFRRRHFSPVPSQMGNSWDIVAYLYTLTFIVPCATCPLSLGKQVCDTQISPFHKGLPFSLSPFSRTTHMLRATIHCVPEGGQKASTINDRKELRVTTLRAHTAFAQRKVAVELNRLFEVCMNRTRWRYEYLYVKVLTGGNDGCCRRTVVG